MTAKNLKDLVRISAAATTLGVTTQTVRNWAESGRLQCVRHPVNGYRLFDRLELERLLASTSCELPLLQMKRSDSLPLSPPGSTAARASMASSESEPSDLEWLRRRRRPASQEAGRVIRVGDAFSGGGVFSLGIEHGLRSAGLGATHSFGIDFDADAIATYRHNFKEALGVHDDVRNVAEGKVGAKLTSGERDFLSRIENGVDILAGGPPCQGHSDLNNHTRRADSKNELYYSMARLAEMLSPQIVMIENVPGVVHDKSGVVSRTIDALKHLGYLVTGAVLDLRQIGVPQSRRRHLIIASKHGAFDFDVAVSRSITNARPTSWAMEDLLDLYDPESIFDSSSEHSAENKRRINYLFDNDIYDLPDPERPRCHREKAHSYKSVYGRMRWNEPAPTITGGFGSTGQGRFVHPMRRRTITPHEACRLQFIPDFFKFPKQVGRRSMQQIIGNAAPPRLGDFAISNAIDQGIFR